jgi:Sortase domain
MMRGLGRRVGGLDKLLVVGVVCMAASSVAVITQLGAAPATALSIPADEFAQPYDTDPGFLHHPARAQPTPANVVVVVSPAATPPPCPAPSHSRIRALPAKTPIVIVIKKLGVDAKVEQAGLDHHGDMQVPVNACDVAWFKPGPVPGAPGDAVLDGHLDWTSGPSVFWNLHQLKRGDEIDILQAGGAQLRFIVSRLRDVPHGTFQTGLFATTGPPTLSLYTCAGTWDYRAQTYSQRLIVDATIAH